MRRRALLKGTRGGDRKKTGSSGHPSLMSSNTLIAPSQVTGYIILQTTYHMHTKSIRKAKILRVFERPSLSRLTSSTSSLLLWERGLQLNPGIDELHMSVVKDAPPVILPILTKLINRSLLTSVFPSAWKESVVLPILKEGS